MGLGCTVTTLEIVLSHPNSEVVVRITVYDSSSVLLKFLKECDGLIPTELDPSSKSQ
jgi:hypothetical protein